MLKNLINRISNKIISVRVIVTLLFTYTYCRLVLWALEMTSKGLLSVETLLGLLAGFTPLVILIIEWYFKRGDRINHVHTEEK